MAEPKPFEIETESGEVLEIKPSWKTGYHWFLKHGFEKYHIKTKERVFDLVEKLGYTVKDDS